jgi:hypothetical protein
MSVPHGIIRLQLNTETNHNDEEMENQMSAKWCLLKTSDGTRGDNGKKKVYEVIIDGKKVRMVWGMAEKDARQVKELTFISEFGAKVYAQDKVREKIQGSGYELVYSV